MEPESIKKKTKQRITRKFIGAIFVVFSLGFLGYAIFTEPQQALALFQESNKKLVLGLLILQLMSFLVNAYLSNQLLTLTSERTNLKNNLRVSIMNEFGNNFMPIAGGSITSYIGYTRIGFAGPAVIFLETALNSLILAQYILFFSVSLFFIPQQYINMVPRLGLLALVIAVFVGAFIGYIFFKKHGGAKFHKTLAKIVSSIGYIFPINFNKDDLGKNIEKGTNKILESFAIFFSRKDKAIYIIFLSAVYFSIDVIMLYLAFLTFGHHVPLALVTFGMILSLLLSVMTLFPGNPGVTEATFVFIFTTFGVPLKIAILAAILYRLTSYWVWMPLATYYMFKKQKTFNG